MGCCLHVLDLLPAAGPVEPQPGARPGELGKLGAQDSVAVDVERRTPLVPRPLDGAHGQHRILLGRESADPDHAQRFVGGSAPAVGRRAAAPAADTADSRPRRRTAAGSTRRRPGRPTRAARPVRPVARASAETRRVRPGMRPTLFAGPRRSRGRRRSRPFAAGGRPGPPGREADGARCCRRRRPPAAPPARASASRRRAAASSSRRGSGSARCRPPSCRCPGVGRRGR